MNAKRTAIIILVAMVSLSFVFSVEFGWTIICAVVTEVCVKHLRSNNIDQ